MEINKSGKLKDRHLWQFHKRQFRPQSENIKSVAIYNEWDRWRKLYLVRIYIGWAENNVLTSIGKKKNKQNRKLFGSVLRSSKKIKSSRFVSWATLSREKKIFNVDGKQSKLCRRLQKQQLRSQESHYYDIENSNAEKPY